MLLCLVSLGGEFDSAAEILRAVASPLRLAILTTLHATPLSVQKLADRLGESQPLVSHHLKILRHAGLVAVRREGRRAIHTTTADPVVGLAVATVIQNREKSMTTTEHAPHTDHDHAHGPDCGHVEVRHGDHVDYAHDGHLHRAHDDHWDECEPTGHTAHDEHTHAHGEGCGHVAVPHGDHVDYVHDGHRHAAHDGHYDEH
jgi:DNA-binding transcriptional ArsR family regulator